MFDDNTSIDTHIQGVCVFIISEYIAYYVRTFTHIINHFIVVYQITKPKMEQNYNSCRCAEYLSLS